MNTEKEIMQYFDDKFAMTLNSRMAKLREEVNELTAAEINIHLNTNENVEEEFIDEVSDVLAVIIHLGHIIGYTCDELLQRAYDKCKIRETNPDYKHSKLKNK